MTSLEEEPVSSIALFHEVFGRQLQAVKLAQYYGKSKKSILEYAM